MATYGLKSITVDGNTYEMNTKNALGISLNGSSLSFDGSTANQSVSFYAPTTAGTNGYFLKSNGSGAPTWAQVEAESEVGIVSYGEIDPVVFDGVVGQNKAVICSKNNSETGEVDFAPLVSVGEESPIQHRTQNGSFNGGGARWDLGPDNIYPENGTSITLKVTFYHDTYSQEVSCNFTAGTSSTQYFTVFNQYGSISYNSSTIAFQYLNVYWNWDGEITYTSGSALDIAYTFQKLVDGDTPYICNYIAIPRPNLGIVDWSTETISLGSDDTFYAEYGVTTHAEVASAISDNKSIFVKGAQGSNFNDTGFTFYYANNDGSYLFIHDEYYSGQWARIKYSLASNNTWSRNSTNIGTTLNGSFTWTPSFYAPTTAGTIGYVLKSNGGGAPTWVSAALTDTKVTVAENTMATKYYPILATGTGTATRQIDTDDQVDSSADAVGLWYQNGILCAPALQVGDVDYSITTVEYEALMDAIDAI